MNRDTKLPPRPHLQKAVIWHTAFHCLAVAIVVLSCAKLQAAEVLLPLKPSSTNNAALHYQRAIILLSQVDPQQQALLQKPIWEIINSETTPEEVVEINSLLIASRYAIRAAMIGATQTQLDFGLSTREYAASTILPHVGSMASLAKLITLYGIQKQAEGDFKRAAEVFLVVTHMGDQMQQQLSLAEFLEGGAIIETACYAFCNWATRCSDPDLNRSVRANFNALTNNSRSPALAFAYEASVVKHVLNDLDLAYPDGNWADLILHVFDADPPANSSETLEEVARATAIENGVAESVFASEDTFAAHIDLLRSVYADYYRESLTCLSLPPSSAIETGQKIYEKFLPQLKALGDPDILNPGQIAAYSAIREAERRITNLVFEISAAKENGKFPQDLLKLSPRFGGKLPVDPISSASAVYSVSDDFRGFEIFYPGTEIAGIKLQKVAFRYSADMNP